MVKIENKDDIDNHNTDGLFFQNKTNNNNIDSGQYKQVQLILLHTRWNMIQEPVTKSYS